MTTQLPPQIEDFITHLRTAGRDGTAKSYAFHLGHVADWLASQHLTPLTVTTAQLRNYQCHLAEVRGRGGRRLAVSTQGTRIAIMKSCWTWLYHRGLRQDNPADALALPKVPKQQVRRDYLTLQEVTAFIQTAAAKTTQYAEGSARWALAVRELALVTLALVSGRRRAGLRDLLCQQVDVSKAEIRVDREKGRTGRVLPIATWSCVVLKTYLHQARPILCWQKDNPFFFVGDDGAQLGTNTLATILERLHADTVKANPDLTELDDKRLTPHSLRVTFASLLFNGGATIRTINELMLHQQLGVTARYIPVNVDDLRRACATAHPRA